MYWSARRNRVVAALWSAETQQGEKHTHAILKQWEIIKWFTDKVVNNMANKQVWCCINMWITNTDEMTALPHRLWGRLWHRVAECRLTCADLLCLSSTWRRCQSPSYSLFCVAVCFIVSQTAASYNKLVCWIVFVDRNYRTVTNRMQEKRIP